MTIAEHLTLFSAALEEWAQTRGASLLVVSSAAELQALIERDAGLVAALVFESERQAEDERDAQVVWRDVALMLARPWRTAGSLQSGEHLATDTEASPALYTLAEEARDQVVGVREEGAAEELGAEYTGMALVGVEVPWDVLRVAFTCGATLVEE